MAATLIAETDPIDVSSLSMLIYGPPGAGKTFIAQTGASPITLDFDKGAHRASNRRAVMRFETWADVAEAAAQIAKHQTVVIDTIGRLLDLLTADITRVNAKHGSAVGGLSLQGYGALKARFAAWVGQLRNAGKDLVFICHEKEEKDGDERIMRPDIQGGSYTEVMKFTDLVGYLGVDRQGKRTLDFNPTDRHLGKNAAGWKTLAIQEGVKTFVADLFADAKKVIGQLSESSAVLAQSIEEWVNKIKEVSTVDGMNVLLKECGAITDKAVKAPVWSFMQSYATGKGWNFDAKAKAFKAKEAA